MAATRRPVPLSQSPALGLSWQIPKGQCWPWNLQANGLEGLSVRVESWGGGKGRGTGARAGWRSGRVAQRLEPAVNATVSVSHTSPVEMTCLGRAAGSRDLRQDLLGNLTVPSSRKAARKPACPQ